jgi:ribosomal protein L17
MINIGMNLKDYIIGDELDIISAADAALNEGAISTGVSKAKDLYQTNPAVITGAIALALTARSVYRKYERNMISFTAHDDAEKRMMADIVDILTKGGKFRVRKVVNKNGLRTWKLKRV